jgi:hypothetical protein
MQAIAQDRRRGGVQDPLPVGRGVAAQRALAARGGRLS